MKTRYHSTSTPTSSFSIVEDAATLHEFYSITRQLGNDKKVRFTSKTDEADNIEWHFTYRRRHLTLQYNIYNGITLFTHSQKDHTTAEQLVSSLLPNKAV
ncbi:Protein of unknown function [Filimonas lacunae]|uniref:DUF3630 domain-containing protein n=1 Tax=Filimonas lacunae TaxID=477680 RepID=A0A173MRL6_9BACT|nr:DUF3630 family protein [Filimonas lacunae]BAV10325.1 hypothetical protein FLA_6387 [Filimonas lacunae]SIT17053.1 Protein of unknown function [Filimonas lacunae]